MSDNSALYDIKELATLGDVSRRTVRYYVQRGLIPAPFGTGRGKHYGKAHLDALLEVKALQARGVALDEIARRVPGSPGDDAPPNPVEPVPTIPQQSWLRLTLDTGIELHLLRSRGLSTAQVQALREAVARALDDDASTST